jgi:hypothetical protein
MLKTYRVLLEKVSNGEALRTSSVTGMCFQLPVVNQPFKVFGEPLTSGTDVRMVSTSLVQEVNVDKDKGLYVVKTLNSTYNVTILPNAK